MRLILVEKVADFDFISSAELREHQKTSIPIHCVLLGSFSINILLHNWLSFSARSDAQSKTRIRKKYRNKKFKETTILCTLVRRVSVDRLYNQVSIVHGVLESQSPSTCRQCQYLFSQSIKFLVHLTFQHRKNNFDNENKSDFAGPNKRPQCPY